MLVVLDSNAFHGDVHANRGLLRSILDDALAAGDFRLFIPQVVIEELDKHFAAETKKVVRDVNQATGEHRDELRRLGLEPPSRLERDMAQVNGYRASLEARLRSAGAEILPIPGDLAAAVNWSVNRRKPFKETGEGFPDAVIWLSILELAAREAAEQIVLVTGNATDFAVSRKRSRDLAPALIADLVDRGCAAGQVRIVPGIGAFAAEIGIRLEPALERARELAAGGAFRGALEERFLETRLEPGPLRLGFDLDEDPRVESVTVGLLEVEDASELPGGRLRIEARAELDLLLDMDIFRSDFPLAEEEVPLSAGDVDFEQTYIEAQADTRVALQVVIVTDFDATEVQLETGEVSLTPLEMAQRALHGRRLTQFFETLDRQLVGKEVEGFVPEETLESDIEEATIEEVIEDGAARLEELIESNDLTIVCQLDLNIQADVAWVSSAPTPFDAENFSSLAFNEESGAPFLQGLDPRCPLAVDLTATWSVEDESWRDIVINTVQVAEETLGQRAARMTASETWEVERLMEKSAEQPAHTGTDLKFMPRRKPS